MCFTSDKPSFRLGPSRQFRVGSTLHKFDDITPLVTQDFQNSGKPITTHEIWSSLLWPFSEDNETLDVNFSSNMWFQPWTIRFNANDISLAHAHFMRLDSGRAFDICTFSDIPKNTNITYDGPSTGFHEGFGFDSPGPDADIRVVIPGLTGTAAKVDKYDDWMVVGFLGTGPEALEDQNNLRVTCVQGSPYVYFEKVGHGNAEFHFGDNTAINVMKLWYHNQNIAVFTRTSSRQTYAIFGPPGSTFEAFDFGDLANRLLRNKLVLQFSDTSIPHQFTIAVLPYEAIHEIIHIRASQGMILPDNTVSTVPPCSPYVHDNIVQGTPECNVSDFLYPQGTKMVSIPFKFAGSNSALAGDNIVYQSFFGINGGVLNGEVDPVEYRVTTGLFSPDFPNAFAVPGLGVAANSDLIITNSDSSGFGLIEMIREFERRAFAVPISTTWTCSYDQENAEVKAVFETQTKLSISNSIGVLGASYLNETLTALKPHHHKYLSSTNTLFPGSWRYNSVNGFQKLISGNTFETTNCYHGFTPFFPDLLDSIEKVQVSDYLQRIKDKLDTPGSGDKSLEELIDPVDTAVATYTAGKRMARLAHLLPIINQQGNTGLRDQITTYIRAIIDNWFDPDDWVSDTVGGGIILGDAGTYDTAQPLPSGTDENVRYFYYSTIWQTLIGFPADFGAGDQLNDHHFHFGYFVQTMAQIVLHGSSDDQNWALSKASCLSLLIKDVANWDRSDIMFPYLRHFNPFNGRSYANGPALFADGNNQESTSEAMNFAAGMILWGSLTDNINMRNTGICLYTIESIAIQQYWFNKDNDNFAISDYSWSLNTKDTPNIGSDDVFSNDNYSRPLISILFDGKASFATFFDPFARAVIGIQFLPVTPASIYLSYMKNQLSNAIDHFGPTNEAQLAKGVGVNLATGAFDFSSQYKMHSWADIFAKTIALFDPERAKNFLEMIGDYLPENGPVPSEWTETRTALISDGIAVYSDECLQLSVYPIFSDTPRGMDGESKANTYYWIHTMCHLGTIETNYKANTVFSATFQSLSDELTFLAYNERETAKCIRFFNNVTNDEYCFLVPGQSLGMFSISDCFSDCSDEIASDTASDTTSDMISDMTSDIASDMTSDISSDMTSDITTPLIVTMFLENIPYYLIALLISFGTILLILVHRLHSPLSIVSASDLEE